MSLTDLNSDWPDFHSPYLADLWRPWGKFDPQGLTKYCEVSNLDQFSFSPNLKGCAFAVTMFYNFILFKLASNKSSKINIIL